VLVVIIVLVLILRSQNMYGRARPNTTCRGCCCCGCCGGWLLLLLLLLLTLWVRCAPQARSMTVDNGCGRGAR
jgi:hypothetical protein